MVMKTLDKAFIAAGIISISFLLIISSCTRNDKKEIKLTAQVVETSLKQNQWKVTYFFKKKNETHNFIGYSFRFNTDGTVVANQSNSPVGGTWSPFNSTNGQVKLNLDFALNDPDNPVDGLNDDWVVAASTETRIVLEDISSVGKISKVTLEKV